MDITKLPLEELKMDQAEAIKDAWWCECALSLGITKYSGGSVRERMETNKAIAARIQAEIERREQLDISGE